jgi:hypothetical protein
MKPEGIIVKEKYFVYSMETNSHNKNIICSST